MVWACCWRSVDTRTYNAARIGGSFLLCCRRRRPTQHQLVRPIPPRLPVRLFAGLPPDLEGAPHGCPSPLPKPQSEGYTRRAPASAAAAATSPDEAGHDGSSRTCHLRSNHRAHLPAVQADPGLDPPPSSAPPRPPTAGPGWSSPATPSSASLGASPTTCAVPGRSPRPRAASPPPGSAADSGTSTRGPPTQPVHQNPAGPARDAHLAPRTAAPHHATTLERP